MTKLLFAAALCVHWFNPLVWVMYALANRDMELSCDSGVIHILGEKQKSAYALVFISLEETKSGGSTLYSHFGRLAITERIEAIMKYKKSSALALVLVIGTATAFAAAASGTNDIQSTINKETQTANPPEADNICDHSSPGVSSMEKYLWRSI